MDIYIKPEKKIITSKTGKVKIKDISKVYVEEPSLLKHINNLTVLNIKENENKCYLITVIDIINIINNSAKGSTISNVGEIDTVVEYRKNLEQNNYWKWTKIIGIIIILFAGSATAIMSFHSDVQMAAVFENYYYIFFKKKIENPIIINLPYSIGIAVGIIVFFNHFCGKKITSDPTPIEVEMTEYEKQIEDNIIDTLSTERGKKNGNS